MLQTIREIEKNKNCNLSPSSREQARQEIAKHTQAFLASGRKIKVLAYCSTGESDKKIKVVVNNKSITVPSNVELNNKKAA